MLGPQDERMMWWRTFGLLMLLCAAWALAVPLMSGPDEHDNQIRAAAVARGELVGSRLPGPVDADYAVQVEVPRIFAKTDALCFIGNMRVAYPWENEEGLTPSCGDIARGSELTEATTYEYRGQPAYYFVVGLPTLPFPNELGAYLVRLAGAAICSALIASALVSMRHLEQARTLLLIAALVLSPSLFYLAATTNGAAVEIAATFGLAASGLALVRGIEVVDSRLVTRFGVALIVLVSTRALSPAFAVAVLTVLALLAGRDRLGDLLARRDLRLWLAGGLLGTILTGIWLVYVHLEYPVPHREGWGLRAAIEDLGWWPREMVAAFGVTDVVPPVALHLLWLAAIVVCIASSNLVGWLERALAAVLLVVSFGLLVSGQGFSFPQTGYYWQGRYVMPMVVLALLLLVAPRTRSEPELASGPETRGQGWRAAIVVPIVLAGHIWSLLYVIRHYTVGFDGPRSPSTFLFDRIWSPPLPPLVLVVLYVGSLAALVATLGRSGPGHEHPAQDGIQLTERHLTSTAVT